MIGSISCLNDPSSKHFLRMACQSCGKPKMAIYKNGINYPHHNHPVTTSKATKEPEESDVEEISLKQLTDQLLETTREHHEQSQEKKPTPCPISKKILHYEGITCWTCDLDARKKAHKDRKAQPL